ncbi:3-hydroxybutyryl-CoA dehydrogenase [Paenibacillus alginolyticus]|uniref:3-hydroxybutyryl-CoA dehydrogenase n=1 Tax=Paenibacillus alginolyticus TaxID=59839 RepID=A0ABT4G694_9BACL|nr:3-hydroxybutyryl-CoA dehydrogenase [Paenibacillus alginolyticus]MCY9667777.1 3-hydroxybutyryl-CoA dehydrogenase [Paenibacillus alginolyticus]MCY9691703.1 3-hydroxybutyryl-CoA dehydrogenase [Paenibacillus alginolyticus]MEC0144053.1 3-hydroxybutyryl-CoA dehydrogenase [Paenibacillus alginolyticus]
MNIQTIMVVGAGQMGSGIVQVAAASGLKVLLHDISIGVIDKGLTSIDKQLSRAVEKGGLTEVRKSEIRSRIGPAEQLEHAEQVDLVIEAISENMGLKTSLFQKLDAICTPKTILASNTSSLPITEIAAVTQRPAQVIGMHFMNPVPVMPLVEVIRGLETSQEVFEAVYKLSERLGKTPVEVKDFPGFVSNRILMPMINEAIFTVYEGVASVESVDTVMKLGMKHPMGPLELADFIGLDTCLSIMEVLYDGFKDSKYRPCPLLRKYVKAGRLGRKSGQGFYSYHG